MNRPIEVGIDGTTWGNERGFGRFTREIVKALAARRGEFRYTLLVDQEPRACVPNAVRVLRVATRKTVTESAVGSGSRLLSDLWALSRAAAGANFGLFFFPAVYSYFPLLSRVPCAVAFHDTVAERYPDLVFPTRRNRWFWRAKIALASRQARRVITVSHASAKDLEDILGIARNRIDVVSEAADSRFMRLSDSSAADATRTRYGIRDRVPFLIYVGGLNPHKNLLSLLRCFPRVLEACPDTHLVIVGDTSGRDFYNEAAELQRCVRSTSVLQPRVHFTGFVSDEDLVALYNGATALVLPSLWEGFGLPAIEAMACGLPVLASRRGSLPETVGEAGLFFDPESTEEMVAVIIRLLVDSGLQKELSQRSLERAASYSWDRAAGLVEDSFRRCLGGRSRPCVPS